MAPKQVSASQGSFSDPTWPITTLLSQAVVQGRLQAHRAKAFLQSSASMPDSAGTAATLPTQDVVDGMSDEDIEEEQTMGKVVSLGEGFRKNW